MLSGFGIFHLDSKNATQLWFDLYVWRLSSDQCMGVMLYARGCCDELPLRVPDKYTVEYGQ
jgi:hypothetical protein